ncbi:MAG TPA: amino acid permease [Blastocatellia bacterium]|nr:amino acid permease [Blastocatellia bacterium]
MSSSPEAFTPDKKGSQFVQKLNLFDATMIVISGIIGSGIFINPYQVAQIAGTPFLILAIWVAGGVLALAGAFVFAELSTVLPKVGGQYAFFREAFHPLVAFLHGWSLLLIIQSGATAAVAVAFATYVADLAGIAKGLIVPLAVAMLLALSAFHALGIKPGAVVINVITFGKTLALAVMIVGAFALTKGSGINFRQLAPPDKTGLSLLSLFFAGLVPVMFTYGGWQNLNFVAEEVRDPLRNLPRAILIGVLCVIAVYVSANFAYVHVLGAPGLAATETPAADLARKLAGDFGAGVISTLISISTFGFLNLALMTAPRVYYAMGADGVFFKSIGRLNPRFRTPTAAILLQGGLAAVFALSNTYKELVSYAVFADWIFFALAGIALMVFRRTRPDAPRPFRTPFYPLTPILFTVVGFGIVANTYVAFRRNALIGTAILLLGVPTYFLWRRAGSIWNGELSLVRTFWVYYVLVSLLPQFMLAGIAYYAGGATFLLLLFYLCYSVFVSVFVSVAVWRAASNYQGQAIWAVLAKTSAVLRLIAVAIVVAALVRLAASLFNY